MALWSHKRWRLILQTRPSVIRGQMEPTIQHAPVPVKPQGSLDVFVVLPVKPGGSLDSGIAAGYRCRGGADRRRIPTAPHAVG